MNAEPVQDMAGVVSDFPKVEKVERGRSSIEWPYFSLDEAFKLAKGVFDLGGNCQIDQLAGHLKQTAAGGAFRLKVQAARTFGLLQSVQGNISLTNLGSQLVEPETERRARAEAFLKVPLYSAIYENFKGKTLPASPGLEGAMVNLGVAVKQKEKARQAFQRSAKESGFFTYGATKLVSPVFGQEKAPQREIKVPESEAPIAVQPQSPRIGGNGSGGGGEEGLHPFIQGLLKTLPPPDTDWAMEGRRKWLQSALSIFDLIYQGSDSGNTLAITLSKTSAI